ncbi:MAG: hypothetical protein ACI39U_09325 [Candidatus Cryptobacteroides sp.]
MLTGMALMTGNVLMGMALMTGNVLTGMMLMTGECADGDGCGGGKMLLTGMATIRHCRLRPAI